MIFTGNIHIEKIKDNCKFMEIFTFKKTDVMGINRV